ncbi:hypothetical protein ACFWVP_29025 [Streptomyces sp. NPDC058637]|uniref:hypothetical protein n=1 Tax=Streptomyces sp. NPDC058637 TaxID=3346569 RepID=UPI00364B055B
MAEVEPAAEVFTGEEADLGQQPVGSAEVAVEEDEGASAVGGPDEHIATAA